VSFHYAAPPETPCNITALCFTTVPLGSFKHYDIEGFKVGLHYAERRCSMGQGMYSIFYLGLLLYEQQKKMLKKVDRRFIPTNINV